MRVHNATQLRESLVQLDMGLGIRGGIELALDNFTVKVQHHQILRPEAIVIHAGGFDDHKPLFAVDAGDVAPGIGDKAAAGELHIGLIDGLFEIF